MGRLSRLLDIEKTEIGLDAPEAASAPWSPGQRIAFRFVFSYFIIYIHLPDFLGAIPGMSQLISAYTRIWRVFVPWVGQYVLHLSYPITIFPAGSGDTTYNYVELLCFFTIAALTTLIWTVLDRKRKQYRRLQEGLRIYLRYYLAFMMLAYGMAKILPVQFTYPGLEKLAEPFGSLSPMNLLWYFMGYSPAYTFFGGLVEASGALLLFFRRTTTLGTLVLSGAMVNVAVLNYCYDVPVKLYSTHLLTMAIFLLIPELRRLADFLVLNRATAPMNLQFPWRMRWLRVSRMVFKVAFIGLALYANTVPYHLLVRMKQNRPKPPLYGIYEVKTVTPTCSSEASGGARPESEAGRWETVVFQYPGSMLAILPDVSAKRYRIAVDTAKNAVTFSTGQDNSEKSVLSYSQLDKDHLLLQGTLMKVPVTIQLQRIDEAKLVLVSRAYHWINEFSFQP